MFLKLIALAALVIAGFGLGTSQAKIRKRTAGVTLLLAVVLHTSVKLALPHDAIEAFVEQRDYTIIGPLVLIVIAAVETAGLWTPVAFVPWTDASVRVWATMYTLGAAVFSAVVYYVPFDVLILNGEILGPTQPTYELDLVRSLPFGIVGFLVGRTKRRKHGRISRKG